MIDSPQPVVEQPPVWLSAYNPAPISGESPTRPGSLLAVPPVDVPAARHPARSSATQPTVSPGCERGRPGEEETGRFEVSLSPCLLVSLSPGLAPKASCDLKSPCA